MAQPPRRSTSPEEPIEWEEISRAATLSSSVPRGRPSDTEILRKEALLREGPPEKRKPLSGLIGCGCLAAVGLVGGLITLFLSILMLASGPAGTLARQLVEGQMFEGPALSAETIWGTLIAPSMVLIVIGAPLTYLGIREWRKERGTAG